MRQLVAQKLEAGRGRVRHDDKNSTSQQHRVTTTAHRARGDDSEEARDEQDLLVGELDHEHDRRESVRRAAGERRRPEDRDHLRSRDRREIGARWRGELMPSDHAE